MGCSARTASTPPGPSACATARARSSSRALALQRCRKLPRRGGLAMLRDCGPLAHERNDMVEGWVVAQLERVVALDPVRLSNLGEQFGLLDRVDPEVGLQVEVHVQEVGRVASLLSDDRKHAWLDISSGHGDRGNRGPACSVEETSVGTAVDA